MSEGDPYGTKTNAEEQSQEKDERRKEIQDEV